VITIILSELNPSMLTLEVVTAITEFETDVTIVMLGEITMHQEMAYAGLTRNLVKIKIGRRRKLLDLISALFKLILQLRKSDTNSIYASGRTASLLGMSGGYLAFVPRRIFTRHHGSENHLFGNKRGILIDRITNLLATRIVAVSNVCKEVLLHKDFVRPEKVIVIYNSFDYERFSAASRHFSSQEIGPSFLEHDALTIGVIGRGVPGKGIHVALSAFALFLKQYPNAKLRLIGHGNFYTAQNLKALESIPPTNLEIVLDSPDICLEYQRFDLFLHLPEFRDFESFGLVYLEAIAAGVPSIFTVSGILAEISCPGFVQKVQSGNIDETYRAMLDFSHNPPVSYEFESKLVTSAFSMQNMRDMYVEIISR